MSKRRIIESLVKSGFITSEIKTETGFAYSTIRYYRELNRSTNCVTRVAEHRKRVKRKAVDYSGGSCIRCSYQNSFAALTFHHIDPTKKISKSHLEIHAHGI